MTKQDKTELDIILDRAGYVLMCCAVFAVIIVMILIYKGK